MPTQFKRYRCHFCERTVVTWKLRRVAGYKLCQPCVDQFYRLLTPIANRPIIKSEVLARSTIIKVPKVSKLSPDYGR